MVYVSLTGQGRGPPRRTSSGLSILSQGCSNKTSAEGRSFGSLTKHILRKSASSSDTSGRGGISSSTMRNSTTPRRGQLEPTQAWHSASPVILLLTSEYGGLPVRSSMIVQPRDQISDAGEAPLREITSGATAPDQQNSHQTPGKQRSMPSDSLQLGVPATSDKAF